MESKRAAAEREDPRHSPNAKGILKKEVGAEAFRLELFSPAEELKPWIEYYWSVSWDLGDRTFVQTVVTNPTIDLSFENDPSTNASEADVFVTGVVEKSYNRVLRGKGEAFAVHFHAGTFRPWWNESVRPLSSCALKLERGRSIWVDAAIDALPSLLNAPLAERVAILDELLVRHRPSPDRNADEIRQLVLEARENRLLWDSKAMAKRRGVSQRTNQRQLLEYVGVGAKWIAQRYRVQAAIDVLDRDRLDSSEKTDLTELALSLGYYDSAHLSRDFRKVTGYSPERYRKNERGRS